MYLFCAALYVYRYIAATTLGVVRFVAKICDMNAASLYLFKNTLGFQLSRRIEVFQETELDFWIALRSRSLLALELGGGCTANSVTQPPSPHPGAVIGVVDAATGDIVSSDDDYGNANTLIQNFRFRQWEILDSSTRSRRVYNNFP